MTASHVALIFLDLDGTLTDPKPGITGAVIHALTQLGMQAPSADDLEWVIGPPLLDSFALLGAPDPQEALEIYRAEYSQNGLFDTHVYADIPDVLVALSAAGHRLVLATAKPHVFARQITAQFGLDRHLAAQFGPELDGTRNDKGELLRYALARLSVEARDAVMVGDRNNDLKAARANGMRFAGALWGYGTPSELSGADTLCETPADLPFQIDRLIS